MATEEVKKEIQDMTASTAAAKEISTDSTRGAVLSELDEFSH